MKKQEILIIDDFEEYHLILSEFMETHFQIKPHTALSIDEAEFLLSIQDFDLIITDFHMPKRNGLEIFEVLKKKNQNTPVIVFSSEELTFHQNEVRKLNFNFVLKSDINGLLKTCASALGRPFKAVI